MSLNSTQQEEISRLRTQKNTTRRATVATLEEVLYEPFEALDHGFVRVVDYMGDDSAVVQAARVSYGTGTKQVNQDRGLINYLMRHRHTTPFEMCEIKFHIKLPIFIARQWIRHRTANVNEYSARYSILDKEFYLPKPEHIAPQSNQNHQGRSDQQLTVEESEQVLSILKEDAERNYRNYQYLMNVDEQGVIEDEARQGIARELARMNLNLNYYTQWYWKIDLHNLLHFLSLRADSHAQYEIRVYAEIMLDLVKKWVPMTYDAFVNYRMNGAFMSGGALNIIKDMIQGKKVNQADTSLSKREWDELMQVLEIKQLETV